MKIPKMVLFDYGQTLIAEQKFDGIKPSAVAERINRLLPENAFEFIITSSNFMFRKPNKRIFDLALEKAGLQPDEVKNLE